jgi:uncharacterized membrane protein
MGPAYARRAMSPSSLIQQLQIVHTYYGKLMPVVTLTAITSGVGWLVLMPSHWSGSEFWLVALATGAVISGFTLTITINFPINAQLMKWSADAPPDNMRELWNPWEKVHTVRTILALTAFALEVVALSMFALQNAGIN